MPWDRPRLATSGFIKTGELGKQRETQAGKKWRPPVKLDHFEICRTVRGDDENLVADVGIMKALVEGGWGDADGKLRQIPIQLHSDDLDEVFPHNLAFYNGKSLICRGDGVNATRYQYRDGKRVGELSMECPCEHSNLVDPKGRCKPNATLHCSIRLPGHGLIGSLHRWRTTSQISISRMMGSLLLLQDTVGSLKSVPLVLVLQKVDLAGKDAVYCCHVELREQSLLDAQRHVLAMNEQRRLVALAAANKTYHLKVLQPGGDHEDEEEQAAVAAEFYPEESEGESSPNSGQVEAGQDDAGQDDLK